MRNISKNKFLLCFRPVLDIDDMLESKVANKHEMKKSSKTKSLFSQHVSTNFSESWIMQHPPKRTLSRVIKAVMFETILKRRVHHKNGHHHDSFGSKYSYGSKKNASQSLLSSSSSHSSTTSSCSSPDVSESSSLTENYSTKENQKESNNGKKQKKSECNGIYLILMSLVFTMFLGKLFGIILTSMCLYIFSYWNSSYGCKKKLLQAKDRGQFGRSATARSEVYHNGH